MNRFLLTTLIIFFICLKASSCLNTYITLRNGHDDYSLEEYGLRYWMHELDTNELHSEADRYWERYERSDSLEYLSDYAATIIYLGEYEKAIQFLNFIERQKPGMYNTASNLGTAYELAGNVDSAYYWIERGITLNPDSHRSSEWIHLKILDYKRSGKSGLSESLLGLDFGSEKIPDNRKGYDLVKLYSQISYQLHERTLFVKPVDTLVGNLYFDLGNIYALQNDWHNYKWQALECYKAAIEYGFSTPLLLWRKTYFETLVGEGSKHEPVYPIVQIVVFGFALLILIILIAVFLHKRKAA